MQPARRSPPWATAMLLAATTVLLVVVVGVIGSAGASVLSTNQVDASTLAEASTTTASDPAGSAASRPERLFAHVYDDASVLACVDRSGGFSAPLSCFSASSGVRAADPLADTSRVSARLQGHVDDAVARFDAGEIGLSPAQARAAARNPNLEPAYRGQVIDSATKRSILADPELEGLYVTRSGEFGPDIADPVTGRWWDVTTPEQWPAHVAKYEDPFGTGYLLPTG